MLLRRLALPTKFIRALSLREVVSLKQPTNHQSIVQVCDLFNAATCNKLTTWYYQQHKWHSTVVDSELVDANTFEKVCEESLNHLAEYFEELVASDPKLEKGDVVYGVSLKRFMPNCSKTQCIFFRVGF